MMTVLTGPGVLCTSMTTWMVLCAVTLICNFESSDILCEKAHV